MHLLDEHLEICWTYSLVVQEEAQATLLDLFASRAGGSTGKILNIKRRACAPAGAGSRRRSPMPATTATPEQLDTIESHSQIVFDDHNGSQLNHAGILNACRDD